MLVKWYLLHIFVFCGKTIIKYNENITIWKYVLIKRFIIQHTLFISVLSQFLSLNSYWRPQQRAGHSPSSLLVCGRCVVLPQDFTVVVCRRFWPFCYFGFEVIVTSKHGEQCFWSVNTIAWSFYMTFSVAAPTFFSLGKLFFNVNRVFFSYSGVAKSMQFIPNTRVPVLQYISNHYGISCDISINNHPGQIKSRIFYWINTIDDRFGDIVLLVSFM
jgi:hypothetical protein